MEKHKWTNEEIEEFRKTHTSTYYFNPQDTSMFVPKRLGVGFTFNYAHPGSWIPFIIVIGLFVKAIIGSITG